jgi:hypothetical protein
MLFFSNKLRLFCASLLLICLLFSPQVHADSQKITEVAGVSLSPQGQQVAKIIKQVFYDAPQMIYVANCESTGLIHRENEKLIISRADGIGAGVFQLQMTVHKQDMEKKGLNPNIFSEYLEFVRHLYDKNGMRPWASSKKCWKKQGNTPMWDK